MEYFFILFSCLFLHCLADFHLQGILGNLKQKKFWEEQSKQILNKPLENTIYTDDYKVALFIHGFECSFITFLPLLFPMIFVGECFQIVSLIFVGIVFINAIFHAVIDNAKANKLKISLVEDQLKHLYCIMISISVCFCLYYMFNIWR